MTSISPYNTHIATYEPIASTTLGSAAADVEFTSIPGTYTDLRLVAALRSTRSNTLDGMRFRYNSDTGSNYSLTYMNGDGSSASSARNSSQTYFTGLQCAGGNNTAFTTVVMDIMSYSNTSVFKTFLSGQGTNGGSVKRIVGLWRSTSAITSILLFPEVGPNWDTGSTFSLYGIKAA